MSAFRDERQAMLARLEQLEQELAGVRDNDKREQILRELSALANRVEVATRRVEEDERALDDIARGIDRIRKSIDGAASTSRESVTPAQTATSTLPGQKPMIVYGALFFALMALMIVGGYVLSLKRQNAGIDLTAPASSIAGFPRAVDASALLPVARAQTLWGKDARLIGIHVDYATSNGLVDLRAATYSARVAFSFTGPQAPPPAPSSSTPLGAPGPAPAFSSVATISVTSTGMSSEPFNLSLSDTGIADPKCTIGDVWNAARAAGAPNDAIAVIDYGTKNVFEGGHFSEITRWHFEIRGTSFQYDIADPGCQVLQKGAPQ